MTIFEMKQSLLAVNSRTLNLREFSRYTRAKLQFNDDAKDCYNKDIFRKLLSNAKINKKRYDAGIVRQFQKSMGGPSEFVIFLGDWGRKQHPRFHEPTIGELFHALNHLNYYYIYMNYIINDCQSKIIIYIYYKS